jgi:hypothetical protein
MKIKTFLNLEDKIGLFSPAVKLGAINQPDPDILDTEILNA